MNARFSASTSPATPALGEGPAQGRGDARGESTHPRRHDARAPGRHDQQDAQDGLQKTGEPWVIVTLEDLTGEITALCFPKTYASGVNNLGKVGAFVAVTGRLSFKGGEDAGVGATAELIVDEMAPSTPR
ncbi:MAG: hypothetical protein M0D55_20265 [Elusimicrobiota bacterium]|nr:MAG: hypothetical protein M0D55_20265 [Elusimicrobiota bacterium]